jgi:2-keto-3-deoxy-L-rhamnonate aldolase RhmA
VARAHRKHAGILVYDAGVAERCVEMGYAFVGVGSDATMLQASARALAQAVMPERATN